MVRCADRLRTISEVGLQSCPVGCGDRHSRRCLFGIWDGHLRAYSAQDGKILWDVDTVRDYQTVNGVPATGGSMNGPGPVVVGGMLFVNSGYVRLGSMPGNVLLAFGVE